LQVNNELIHFKNQRLKDAVTTKQKYKKKSKPLDLQQKKKFCSKAVFWGPVEIQEACNCKEVQEHEEEQERLQKTHTKELKKASRLCEKQKAAQAKEDQKRAAGKKKEECKAKALECNKNWAQKQQEKEAATMRKLAEQARRAIPTTSRSAAPISTKRRCALGDVDGNVPGPLPPQPPPKHTTHGWQIKVPKKFA
jgi:hypothetical protein